MAPANKYCSVGYMSSGNESGDDSFVSFSSEEVVARRPGSCHFCWYDPGPREREHAVLHLGVDVFSLLGKKLVVSFAL